MKTKEHLMIWIVTMLDGVSVKVLDKDIGWFLSNNEVKKVKIHKDN